MKKNYSFNKLNEEERQHHRTAQLYSSGVIASKGDYFFLPFFALYWGFMISIIPYVINPMIGLIVFTIYSFIVSGKIIDSLKYVKDMANIIDKDIQFGSNIPFRLHRNNGWVNVMQALDTGDLLELPSDYKTDVFKGIKENLFKTGVEDHPEQPEAIRDMELAHVWRNELSTSPLLERIAFLLNIDSEEKIESFNRMTDKEKIEFLEPIKEFHQRVLEIRENKEKSDKEINKIIGSNHDAKVDMNTKIMLNQVLIHSKNSKINL